MLLQDFTVIRPRFESTQESLLDWVVKAHSLNEDSPSFAAELRERLHKIGLGENKIQKRGFHIADATHENWDEMEIFSLTKSPEGASLKKRMAFYEKEASELFSTFFPNDVAPHLVHVSCTGYVAPSPGQRLISQKGLGSQTTLTNAYHMGCYGAIPAIRMGMGHLAVEQEPTDIVHTEFCTLHFNPTLHSTEQLVVQSLFADGFVKYRVGEANGGPGLKIAGVLEEVIPDSTDSMSWMPSPWGFEMTLAKEIPVLIRRHLKSYLERLAKKVGLKDLTKARFAIHPGGPKIIEQIAAHLELEECQTQHSKDIMKSCGNMSSATLPHIWDRMLQDPEIKDNELIVSLAFGPGLTICGALFEKRL